MRHHFAKKDRKCRVLQGAVMSTRLSSLKEYSLAIWHYDSFEVVSRCFKKEKKLQSCLQ